MICTLQIGSSMISNYELWITLVLALLHLTLGLVVDILTCFFIKRKNTEDSKIHKIVLIANCIIILFPYLIMVLLWIVGWL